MFKSISGIPAFKRDIVLKALAPVATDLFALAAVAKKAHVNVRGPHFVALHGLFGELYKSAGSNADRVAEYGANLGSPMAIDHKDLSASSVPGLPTDVTDGLALCSALLPSIEAVKAKVDAACRIVSIDKGAEQILIDVSLMLGKIGWMIGAHVPEVEGAVG